MRNYTLVYIISYLLIYILIMYYNQAFFLKDDLYRLLIGSQMSERQFVDYMEFMRKWQWVSYLFIPVAMLLRICFIWLCLKAGSFVTENFTDSPFWNITIQAELVFVIGALAGLLYTEFFVDVATLEQLSINPFSLQVVLSQSVPKWSNYLFNTLNLFELGYILFLTYLLASASKKTFIPSLKFVASTYLPGLALWVLLVTYFSVVFQP